MVKYCKEYIKKYYEHFRFFKPECMDRRIRDVMMKKRTCHECPGHERCLMHPEFWLEGEDVRSRENDRLLREFPDQGEIEWLPEDITEDIGAIEIKQELPEIEARLGI